MAWWMAVALAGRSRPCDTGGVALVVEAPDPTAAAEALSARLEAWGLTCTEVRPRRGVVEVWLPAVGEADARTLLTESRLGFFPVTADGVPMIQVTPEGPRTFLVDRANGLPDARVSDVRVVQEAGEPMTSIVLDGPSGAAFAALTAAHVGEALVVALDDRVLAAPLVREPISGGRVYLSGAEAEGVLSALTAPRLPEGLVLRSIEVIPAR